MAALTMEFVLRLETVRTRVHAEALRVWMRGRLLAFGMTPFWADRFLAADSNAFDSAMTRVLSNPE